jgi:hypothetical protein
VSTYSDLIRDALGLIGVLDETEQPTAEQGTLGLRVLDEMLTDWEARGIDVGFAAGAALNDQVSIEDTARRAVKLNLAEELCPWFEREPSPRMLTLADAAYSRLLREAMKDQLVPASMSHLHRGAGDYPADIENDE